MHTKILGTGLYLPKKVVLSTELEQQLGLDAGSIQKSNGVEKRHFADLSNGETTSQMAAWALLDALKRTEWTPQDLDLIVFASAGPEQGIPDTAPLIQDKIGLGHSGCACFSVHSTCLSALTALDIAAGFLELGRHQRIAIVSAELSSLSINPNDPKTYTLFGDAAVAILVERTPDGEASRIHNSHFVTFGEAALLTEVPGCGTRRHPNDPSLTFADNTFRMKGREILRYSLQRAPAVLGDIWPSLPNGSEDIDIIIPHQPSRIGMNAFARYLPPDKTISTLADYGNCVSASLPLTLHSAIESGRLQRGDKALLFGTGAGLTIAGMVLTF